MLIPPREAQSQFGLNGLSQQELVKGIALWLLNNYGVFELSRQDGLLNKRPKEIQLETPVEIAMAPERNCINATSSLMVYQKVYVIIIRGKVWAISQGIEKKSDPKDNTYNTTDLTAVPITANHDTKDSIEKIFASRLRDNEHPYYTLVIGTPTGELVEAEASGIYSDEIRDKLESLPKSCNNPLYVIKPQLENKCWTIEDHHRMATYTNGAPEIFAKLCIAPVLRSHIPPTAV